MSLTFSQLNPYTKSASIDPTASATAAYMTAGNNRLRQLAERSRAYRQMTDRENRQFDAMLGRGSLRPANPCASNLRLRLLLSSHLRKVFAEQRSLYPHRRYFLVTLINDCWLTYDREPYIWLGSMRQTIPAVMNLGSFDGWYATIEFQMLDETRRGLGRIIMGHVHALAWSDEPIFHPLITAAAMRQTNRLFSDIDAPTVKVSPALDSHPNPFIAYLNKQDCFGKKRTFDPDHACGFALDPCVLPPVASLRILELLTLLKLPELIVAGGSGAAVGWGVRKFIADTVTPVHYKMTCPTDIPAWWHALHQRSVRPSTYADYSIDRGLGRMPRKAIVSLASPALAELAAGSPTMFV